MLDDISKSIKAQLYERVSSPLLASFGLSWLAWNYRFVMALTSSLPLNEKFYFIDTQIFPSYQHVLLQGSLYPLITALLLIFAYPIPAKYVYEYWRRRQRDLKEVQQRIDDETPLSREEAREIRRQALKASLEYDKEIQSKSAEIARLKELIAELQQTGSSIAPVQPEQGSSSGPPDNPDDLDDLQIGMLDEIARSTDGVLKKRLLTHWGDDMVLAEYNLGELKRRGFVTENFSGARADYVVKATHPARALLVRLGQPRNVSA